MLATCSLLYPLIAFDWREKLREELLQGFLPGAVVVGFVAGVSRLGVGCYARNLADSAVGVGGLGAGCSEISMSPDFPRFPSGYDQDATEVALLPGQATTVVHASL